MKKRLILFALFIAASTLPALALDALGILQRVDDNQYVERQIIRSSMTIHSLRGSRTIEYKSWIIGEEKSFTETLAPARDKGTKMLKMEDNLWTYHPRADRTIRIAGHMLRQSMMGSDLSYEDMMEKGKMQDNYHAAVEAEESYLDRPVWVLHLKAKTPDIAYQQRKLWVDRKRFIILKAELFAASGKLLKRWETREVFKTSRGWYPRNMLFKDVLKKGKGTEYFIHDVDFDTPIPKSKFSKSALRR
ncbi:MAG: outer membrane lipoprotein-sorting protein [Proteobacteria bacterium]|nr:outer membrane lipoprotein-sorting protein [Pseudomonadota bacterium]